MLVGARVQLIASPVVLVMVKVFVPVGVAVTVALIENDAVPPAVTLYV